MTIRMDALPELAQAWTTLEQLAASNGVQITIANDGGFRTQADTTLDLGYRDADYAAYVLQQRAAGKPVQSENDWRPIAPYGESYHNYGAARDFAILIKPSSMSTDDAMALVRNLAPAAGLRAIYPGTNDPDHLELPIPLAQAEQWWSDYQNGTGHYAPAANSDAGSSDDGSSDDSSSGGASSSSDGTETSDGTSDDGSDTSGASDSTTLLLLALVALTVGGVIYAARQRFAQR